MWVAQDKIRYESVYSINVYSHPLRIGSISVCGPGIVFRKPDLEGLNRAVEFVNSIKLLVDVFANNGIVSGEACCAHGVLDCLEIHVDSKKRELRGCHVLQAIFFSVGICHISFETLRFDTFLSS